MFKHRSIIMSSPRGFDGGDELTLDKIFSRPDVKEAMQNLFKQQLEKETSGLRANKEEILTEKRQLAEKLASLEGQVEGLDLGSVREILKRIEGDEEASLLKDGKIEDVVQKRVERAILEARKDVEAVQKKLDEATEGSTAKDAKIHKLVVESELRRVAGKMGVADTAIDDFVSRGMATFQAHEIGGKDVAVQLDEEGSPVRGKDGKTPLMPEEWGEGLRESAPHLWPASAGGGANGGGSGTKSKDGKPDADKMTPKQMLSIGLKVARDAL